MTQTFSTLFCINLRSSIKFLEKAVESFVKLVFQSCYVSPLWVKKANVWRLVKCTALKQNMIEMYRNVKFNAPPNGRLGFSFFYLDPQIKTSIFPKWIFINPKFIAYHPKNWNVGMPSNCITTAHIQNFKTSLFLAEQGHNCKKCKSNVICLNAPFGICNYRT